MVIQLRLLDFSPSKIAESSMSTPAAPPAAVEDASTSPPLPRKSDISEASALAAQFVIKHQEAAKKAAAQSTTAETNNASTTSVGNTAAVAPPSTESPSSGAVESGELLDSELSSFVGRVALTEEDHHVHNHILGSILSVARSHLDIEATIETFGSAASGLSEKSSDIDATIICRFSALKKRFAAAVDEKSLCSAAVLGLGKAISKFEKEAPGVGLRVVQVLWDEDP